MALDPITVQILKNKIASLVDEMHYHFYRSGYSTIIRESRDFSCVILDKYGRLIVPPPMFFHAPFYKHFVDRTIEIHGAHGLADGDGIVSNHPYEAGVPHVSDMAFIAPIFAGGVFVGSSGSCAHKADIGGTNPGSTSARHPSGTTMVASNCSAMAGPSNRLPAGRSGREKMAVSNGASEANQTWRVPFDAASGAAVSVILRAMAG